MKIYRNTKCLSVATLAFATVVFQLNLVQAQEASVTPTNISRSVFVIPKDSTEGRDPFFPNTTRSLSGGKSVVEATATATAAAPITSLILNGLSGAPGHRLAMINGRTFAQGETSEVPVGSGFVKVLCVEIKERTVLVEAGGTRQELSMRGEK
jgi:hypothetical protein